ncbi:alpha-L-fucosidase 2 [Mucilaginibacter gracilis]|uniref:Alpha-L-fucosidase 2 n=1 Tax=Mucilaginibacter gracilis TaxID=423350 RepID=A0A495J6X5_9SPHI|nr:glycoside hydrolase family 95 protein [Mucilaginibacter gracilis]RKR84352.1 alpha-L-fucosidase 2 [Mucilaginibacter gracilis]
MKSPLYIFTIAVVLCGTANTKAQQSPLKLWYNQPAEKWTDALPIGNGTLGAMIYGGANSDRIQFNEQTLWTGEPRSYQRTGASTYLPTIRKLLFEGKRTEAEALAGKYFMGEKNGEDTYPARFDVWFKKVTANNNAILTTLNNKNWHDMKIPTTNGWESSGIAELAGLDGVVWLRNAFELPKGWTGKNLVIDLGRIRDMDITYINGKKIGSTDSTSVIRRYKIDGSLLKEGRNEIAIQVINPFDKGGLVGGKSGQKTFSIYPYGENPEDAITLNPVWQYWIQDYQPPASPRYQAEYQPFGDLILNFKQKGKLIDYKRDLDIGKAIATTSYTCNGIRFTRQYLASYPDKVIVIHLKADKAGQINLDALLQTPHKLSAVSKIDAHTIGLNLKVQKGVLKGASYLYATAKSGIIKVVDNHINITNADDVTLYLTAATSFKNYLDVSAKPEELCKQTLQTVKTKTFVNVKERSIKDYQKYFNTFSVNLGAGKNQNLPTNERIAQYSFTADPRLLSLYIQYARYLLIACSRPDSKLPANLQGIWNDQLVPPWGSKFTTNINLQMNYWSAEELNLSACIQPLFKMIGGLSTTGAKTAKVYYNAPGWVVHHNTDIWLGTAPIDAPTNGIWQSGAGWLCHHLWEHYLYTQDTSFLKQHYPEMKAAAQFFVSTLVHDPQTGYLISTPSTSPEHGGLVAGPAMDRQIIRDLFKNCITASQILKTDLAFRKTLEEKYMQIAPNKIGKYGQLQEWMEDRDDTTDTHRHVSHLWGVYPGTDITWDGNADIMKAAEKSFKYRGDEGTGWSLAWKVNLMARFKKGDHAMMLVNKLLSVAEIGNAKEKGGVYNNLFDAHPPFQIDGNFGGAAGIAEMLLQSQQGYIDLLPALPTAIANGEVKGICARGGFVLNLKWQNGKLMQVQVTSKAGGECLLKYGSISQRFKTIKGKSYSFNGELKAI